LPTEKKVLDLNKARVLVTGASGLLGRHVCRLLREQFPDARLCETPGRSAGGDDLTELGAAVAAVRWAMPDVVFHLAGRNGGIAFNAECPADVFFDNTAMALNVLRACARADRRPQKVVLPVASCAYSPLDAFGLDEKDFFAGLPDPSVRCHGLAKRNVQWACQFYRSQYGLRAVTVCPPTLFGEGDRYEPGRSKVVAGMVKRFCDAVREGRGEVTCWGSGRPLREVLYAGDAARLLVRAALYYDDSALPLNVGAGQEHTVEQLAALVARAAGYRGAIRWDATRPDGQLRKRLCLDRMYALLGGCAYTPIEEALRRTVEDYRCRH
jgi:GDP-L-fucose synthase